MILNLLVALFVAAVGAASLFCLALGLLSLSQYIESHAARARHGVLPQRDQPRPGAAAIRPCRQLRRPGQLRVPDPAQQRAGAHQRDRHQAQIALHPGELCDSQIGDELTPHVVWEESFHPPRICQVRRLELAPSAQAVC